MNKQEFISQLQAGLSGLPECETEERLSFYSEMIEDRIDIDLLTRLYSTQLVTKGEKHLLNILTFCSSFFSIFYSFALAFSVSDVTIDTRNPELFLYLSEMVQFWL